MKFVCFFFSAPIQQFYDSQTIPNLRFVRLSSNDTGKTYRNYVKEKWIKLKSSVLLNLNIALLKKNKCYCNLLKSSVEYSGLIKQCLFLYLFSRSKFLFNSITRSFIDRLNRSNRWVGFSLWNSVNLSGHANHKTIELKSLKWKERDIILVFCKNETKHINV